MGDEEYDLSDSEDEVLRASTTPGSVKDEDETSSALATSKVSESELESEHSEWFKVRPGDLGVPRKVDDSETEDDNDSDNYDLNEPDTVEDSDGGEWLSISGGNRANVQSSTGTGTQSTDSFDLIEASQVQTAMVGC